MIPAMKDEAVSVDMVGNQVRTQVQNLYGRAMNLERSRDSGKRGEINLGRFRVSARQFGHQC